MKKIFTPLGIIAVAVVLYFAVVPRFAAPRKVSIEKSILNNLRMIVGHGQMALLESGEDSIYYSEIASSNSSFYQVKSYDGEDYSNIEISRKSSIISAKTENHGVIQFEVDSIQENVSDETQDDE